MASSRRISLIGCGQMGSRHLQAIAKLDCPLRIQVVEPCEASRLMGLTRLKEVMDAMPSNYEVDVEWHKDFSNLDAEPDLTIVATTASARASILRDLARRGHRRFLVEKVLCQSAEEYEGVLEILGSLGAKAWVNTPRPYFPAYKKIIRAIYHTDPIYMLVAGGNHGLGSNAIHFLDLFMRLCGTSQGIRLTGDSLSPAILHNTRGPSLAEFSGTLSACTERGDFASISFHPSNMTPVVVHILSNSLRALIDEGDEKALLSQADQDWKWEQVEFRTIFTSALTTEIAKSIFENDTCDLTSVEDSYPLHVELFRVLNEHLEKVTGNRPILCPIT
jgi:predicted dehydrogenase